MIKSIDTSSDRIRNDLIARALNLMIDDPESPIMLDLLDSDFDPDCD